MRRELELKAKEEVRIPLQDAADIKKNVYIMDEIIYRNRGGVEKRARVYGWMKTEDGRRDMLILIAASGTDYPVPLPCCVCMSGLSYILGGNMVSSSLQQLRQAPQGAGDIIGTFNQASAKVRQDIYLAQPARVQRLTDLVTTARDALLSLQDSCNTAETRINAAAQTTNADVSEAAERKIRWAFDEGLNLHAVLGLLVEDNDAAAFNALSANVGLLARAGKLGFPSTLPLARQVEEARSTIAEYRKRIATKQKLIALSEQQELFNMGFLRNSFARLFSYLQSDISQFAQGSAVQTSSFVTGSSAILMKHRKYCLLVDKGMEIR